MSDGGIFGQDIVAADSGTVIYHEYNFGSYGWGTYLKIDHGDGIVTLYAHCSKLLKTTGDTVDKGETIALVGNTGNSTGPHLHFEVIVNGLQMNPLDYVSPP